MRPRRRSARAPVNRFPEDVDQFRLERRRGMEKRERREGLSPSRASERMRENLPLSILGLFITAHPFFFSSFCYPLSVVPHPSPVRRLFLSSFSSRRKNAPFGLRALVASVVPIEKESERLRFSPFALSPPCPSHPCRSFFFFIQDTRSKAKCPKARNHLPSASITRVRA